MTTAAKLRISSWTLTAIVSSLAIYRWYDVRLSDGSVGPYEFFPLLGLLAFSLMWSHYVTDAIRRFMDVDDAVLKSYFHITSWVVLFLILLHPGIFWVTLFNDGFGLPPASYLSVYTDAAARIALLLGTTSLVVFLAFELHRKFKDAPWWKYVEYANVAAMFAIFYHALTLGGEVASGWFRVLWLVYGLVLAGAISYNYYHKRVRRNEI